LAFFETSGSVSYCCRIGLYNFFLGQRPSLFHHGLFLEDTSGLTSQGKRQNTFLGENKTSKTAAVLSRVDCHCVVFGK